MNFFERRAILKKANFLLLTPIRIVGEEIDSKNNVILLMPKFASKFAKKTIVPMLRTPYIRIKLDELGSAAWLCIDGKKNVHKIAEELTTQLGDKIQPVEKRLTDFLTILYNQNLITFAELQKPE